MPKPNSGEEEKGTPTPTHERRVTDKADVQFEVRVADEKPRLVGYAALFNKPTELFPGYNEQIATGAFARSLKENADVRALVDHDPSKILGRTTSGTLELEENAKGLKATIFPPDTQPGRDIVESVRRGDVFQMSFAFTAVEETWKDHKDGSSTRTLVDVDLFDVSAVTYPAYPDTVIAVRALASHRDGMRATPFERKETARRAIEVLRSKKANVGA